MKSRIIEICELAQTQSIIHRENEPITEFIKTDSLIEELNEQLLLYNVVHRRELLLAAICEYNKYNTQNDIKAVYEWLKDWDNK